jgi:hypothetical protein
MGSILMRYFDSVCDGQDVFALKALSHRIKHSLRISNPFSATPSTVHGVSHAIWLLWF